MGRVKGKTAIVTGGVSGIGRACGQRLAEQGAWVRLLDRNVSQGAAAAELGDQVSFSPLDVSAEPAWQEAIKSVVAARGGVDILVNAAGIFMRGPDYNPETTTLEDWRSMHAVNMEGVFLGCKHAIPAMRDSGGGSIVNISSVAGLRHTLQFGASWVYRYPHGPARNARGGRHCRRRARAISPGDSVKNDRGARRHRIRGVVSGEQ